MSDRAESECIYNILGKKPKRKQSGMYRSKFPHNIAPTGSTFINKNTTRPGIANLAGEFRQFKGGHEYKFATQTFGKPKGQNKQDQQDFQRRGAHQTNPVEGFKIKQEHTLKAAVPKYKKEDQVQNNNLENTQKKNFLVLNAIDIAMMNVPQKNKVPLSIQKPNYGQVPKYLETVKKDIEKEYRVYQKNMRTLRGEPEPIDPKQPTKQELVKLREKLKDQWTEIYNKYSKMAHKTKFDTLIEKEKKATYEKELNKLEVDIRKLRTAIQNAVK